MVYPNDQNSKNFVLFYLPPSVPKAACGKSPELWARAPGAEVVRVGKLKLTFYCVFFVCVCVCVCVCVRSICGRVKHAIAPVFLLMQCKSGSLTLFSTLKSLGKRYSRIVALDEKSRRGNYGLSCVPYGGE